MSEKGKKRNLKRGMWAFLGLFFVALGAVGAVLPLLPTTPFLLLAAYCFSRSSDRLHKWLLGLPWAGDVIRDWEEHKAIRLKTKIFSVSFLIFGVSCSYYWLLDRSIYIRLTLIGLALIGVFFVLRQKTRIETPVQTQSEKEPKWVGKENRV